MPELVSVLILTRNEELHIARCLDHAFMLSSVVYVLDSNSSDRTQEIARSKGAVVLNGDFESFSDKLNWGLENIEFTTPWVMRLDADEVLEKDFIGKVRPFLAALDLDTVGVYVRRQLWFMGKWIKHGGMYPTYSMRLWRPGTVVCETRRLDEHMLLKRGRHTSLDVDVADIPLADLSNWISKHNGYSSLEAQAALEAESSTLELIKPDLFGTLPQRVRWLKTKVFYRLPPFIRPCLYFFYRYVVRLGFLDGRTGLIFHFMHGLWYRMLVDAKIIELMKR